MVVFETKTASQTRKLGEELGRLLCLRLDRRPFPLRSRRFGLPIRHRGSLNLALDGELGSGKTTFVKGLAVGLGIKRRITSPTFVMVRSYLFGKNRVFYHVDLYRYHQSGSASFGVNEILSDPTGLVAVEWAENFRGRLPKGFLKIRFTYTLSGRRIELLWL